MWPTKVNTIFIANGHMTGLVKSRRMIRPNQLLGFKIRDPEIPSVKRYKTISIKSEDLTKISLDHLPRIHGDDDKQVWLSGRRSKLIHFVVHFRHTFCYPKTIIWSILYLLYQFYYYWSFITCFIIHFKILMKFLKINERMN